MSFVDYYQVLGIAKTATTDEIKKAFRQKAKESHPDVGGHDGDFIRIKLAYDILSNPKSRKEYDDLSKQSERSESRQTQEPKARQSYTPKQEKQQYTAEETNKKAPEIIFNWKPYITVLGVVIVVLVGARLVSTTSSNDEISYYPTATNVQQNVEPAIEDSQSSRTSVEISVIKNDASYSESTSTIAPQLEDDTVSEVPHFTLGSTKAEVKNVMGEPSTIEEYASLGDVWRYGMSSINFSPNGKVEGWTNFHDGRANIGTKKSDAKSFALNSSKQDVVNVMGTPDTIEEYNSLGDVWRYGVSSINFNTKDRVVGWTSFNDGKASIGEKKSEGKTFTLGSTKQEVVDAMGTPGTIEEYDSLGDVWRYGISSINFDTKNRVVGWTSFNDGKAYIGEKKSEGKTFTLGSTKQEVVDAMGTPDTIEEYNSLGDVWRYGVSSVSFNTKNKVDGWSSMHDGRAYLGDIKPDATAIGKGSTMKQVIDALGTPNTIESYDSLGDVWRYGLSSIEFNTNGKVAGWTDYNGLFNN